MLRLLNAIPVAAALWAATAPTAQASDVWMRIVADDGGDRFSMYLPAEVLADDKADAGVETVDGTTVHLPDLVDEVRRGPVGTTKSVDVKGAKKGSVAHVTLSHLEPPPNTIAATEIRLSLLGPGGKGLTLSFTLADGLGKAATDADLDKVPGVTVNLTDAGAMAVIGRYPGAVLIDVGARGGSMRIESH